MSGPPLKALPALPPPRQPPAVPVSIPEPVTLNRQEDEEEKKPTFYEYRKPEYEDPAPYIGISELVEEGYVETLYKLGKFLGCGGFAEVYHAVDLSTESEYAIKIIDKVLANEGDPKAIKNEVEIMKTTIHANVVNFVKAFETPFRVYIVMEYLGEPLAVVENKLQHYKNGQWVPPYTENAMRLTIIQLLNVLSSLHENGIIHRDIKPENFLWTFQDASKIKLIDFGMAIYMPKEPLLQWVGTAEFQAPEMVSQLPEGYNYKIDMWSLGCLIYFLVVGHLPFEHKNRILLEQKIKNGTYSLDQPQWSSYSSNLKDLIVNLLSSDPNVRYTAKQALSHPWITAATV
jgi:serine/threonine protein kinase